jgi:K+-sensing histidine kinase KdpD
VLYQERDPNSPFIAEVLRLCRAFAVAPVVLTFGRSEVEARRRQHVAVEAFAAARAPADFDLIASCEVHTAVAHVARWRKCSHVFLAKHYAPPWQRWLRGDALQRLLGLSDSLALLAVPTSSMAPSAVTALTAGEASPIGKYNHRASTRPAFHADESLNVPFDKNR